MLPLFMRPAERKSVTLAVYVLLPDVPWPVIIPERRNSPPLIVPYTP